MSGTRPERGVVGRSGLEHEGLCERRCRRYDIGAIKKMKESVPRKRGVESEDVYVTAWVGTDGGTE